MHPSESYSASLSDSQEIPIVGQMTLDNGMQVVWEEDHRHLLIAIEARIKGGLRGEGRFLGTGITHFIEHMLFKGTPTRPAGTIEQEVRSYGGTINAFTSFDTTGVSLFVESRYLKEALGMLADILQHAVFNPAEFEKERAVIISEIQMNLDDPDRRIHQMFFGRHFLEHPYRHPILGYQSLLEKLTVEDLQNFYKAHYHPQQITLACVGDLEAENFQKIVQEQFESWPRGPIDPSQAIVAEEPPVASGKEVSAQLPVQTTYGFLGFSSVRLFDPKGYALDVLANILGQGRSSRLYEALVHQRQLAHSIAAWNYTPYDPGVFVIPFRTDSEQVEPLMAAIRQIILEIQEEGITEAELAKAKRGVRAEYFFSRQTIESRAGDLASSMAATGDPLYSRQYVLGIERVNRADVQEVARHFCDFDRKTVALIYPRVKEEKEAQRVLKTPHRMDMKKGVLSNGATTLIGIDRTLPIASIVVAFRGGVRAETEPQQGLSNLVAHLLTKGTRRHSALEIAQQVESLGGRLEPFSGRDGFGLSLQLLSEDLEAGLNLLHELVIESSFSEKEVGVQKTLILQQRQAQDDEIFIVGGRLLRQALFKGHPYRFDPLGSPQTLPQLSHQDCLQFAQQWIVPSNMVIAVAGDLNGT
ncbi:MAG: insulinase family protein, partial [Candidatus Omnitrophica bacterium]|nr:insulinase family protein [Candidatus Omnitrophota bacterium]